MIATITDVSMSVQQINQKITDEVINKWTDYVTSDTLAKQGKCRCNNCGYVCSVDNRTCKNCNEPLEWFRKKKSAVEPVVAKPRFYVQSPSSSSLFSSSMLHADEVKEYPVGEITDSFESGLCIFTRIMTPNEKTQCFSESKKTGIIKSISYSAYLGNKRRITKQKK